MGHDLDDEELRATREMHKRKDEAKVGEYIRTEHGEIGKVTKINGDIFFFGNNNETWSENITKHNKNLIALLEVGDVFKTKDKTKDGFGETNTWFISSKEQVKVLKEYVENIQNIEIISILTHEQYDRNCNRVEDNK